MATSAAGSSRPSRGRRSLRPTFSHARRARYLRAGGPWDQPGLDTSFAQVQRVQTLAVADDHVRLDAEELERLIASIGGRLRGRGVRRGDVVAWQLPNGASALSLYRACWRLGAIAAPLHHRLGKAEVAAALEQVEPLLVVATAGSPASEHPGAIVLEGPGNPADLVALLPPAPSVPVGSSPARGSDLAVVLFTSGSTGVPKAVLHTHRALGYKARSMVAVHGLGNDDAVLMPAPLAHVSGLLNGVLIPAAAGIPSVLMSSWDADEGLSRIESHRVSFMGAPPVFFSQMARAAGFGAERVRSMRLISTGGASVSPAFVDATAEAFGCRVKRTYGSTEAPTVTTSGPEDDPGRARDTDGRTVGEVEAEIHDQASGERLGAGETGELWLRGPELFVGYAAREATERVVVRPGGWFRTGDVGVLDDEGWLRVVGRLSDIVIRAGENISASEVEAVLEAHPAVRHAVAVGVPDTELGERLAVYVETSSPFDLELCRRWFAERGVTRFKTPEIVVRLDRMPLLAAGKTDRAAIRELVSQLAPE